MNFVVADYFIMALLLILIVASLAIYFIKDLLHAVIIYGAYTLTMALIWLQMNSPDLAITEAAAGIVMTILMMVVIFRTNRMEDNPIHNQVADRYINSSLDDTGVSNMVTSIVLDYRAYDTMFETIVLFVATLAVMITLKPFKEKERDK